MPPLFPGTEKALEELRERGFKLGIATNGSGKTAREILAAIGVSHLFDVFTGADEVAYGKPDPAMLFLACERLGVKPSRGIYVGDESTDMTTAVNAGFLAGFAVEADEDLSGLAGIVLGSVSELTSLLG